VPNNEFRQLTLSGSAGAALGHGATLRFVGRAERGKTGTSRADAFGPPDLDAFYQRHDGTWGVSFDQTPAPSSARGVRPRDLAPGVDQPAARSALHAVVRRTHGAVRVLGLPFDSRTDLRRHHASYQADGTIATPARARTSRPRSSTGTASAPTLPTRWRHACRPRATTSA
jgi:hypothetical protein